MSEVRLQVIDPQAKFSCGGCTRCCTQPYTVIIEQGKADALLKHDFSAYPQLAGKTLFTQSKDAPKGYAVLPKQAGTTRCLFLADDGLCIIHKELGADSKPKNCLKYPFHLSPTYVDDRVSLDFGCPNVQNPAGRPLSAQGTDVVNVCPPTKIPVYRDAKVDLSPGTQLPHDAYELLMDRCELAMTADNGESIWTRFARILRLLQSVETAVRERPEAISAWIAAETTGLLKQDIAVPQPFFNPSAAPSPVRMMFAATLLRDVLPADATLNLSMWRRIRLLPKLMSLAKLTGSYDSKFLGYEIDIDAMLRHPLEPDLDPAATALLQRYYRTRIWQRFIAGTRLSVVAGFHQHIQDLNAVLFLARAMAHHQQAPRLTEALVAEGLSRVEFNIANQPRVFDQKSLTWFTGQLDNPVLAMESLRLMALGQAQAAVTTSAPLAVNAR
jgi:Fe-S-cluster containining protein